MGIVDKSISIARELFPGTYNNEKDHYRTFHYAFAYRRNKLLAIGDKLAIGANSYGLDKRALDLARRFKVENRRKYPYFHAETAVLARMWGRYHIDNSIKLVVLRLNLFGELKNSKPCLHCRMVLDALNVCRVWYSTSEGKIERL